MAQMQDTTLTAICEQKLNSALGWLGGRLSKDRQSAEQYYRGDLFGNELEGRSKVVSRDVAEAIDGALPGILKPFVSSDTVVNCQARRPEDEDAAKQATDYLNWVFQSQPNAFELIQTWVKGGLKYKLSVVKSWWDEQQEVLTEEYEGLTKFQYLTLLSDPNVAEVSCTSRPADQPAIDPDSVAEDAEQQQAPANPGALPPTPANTPGGAPQPPGAPGGSSITSPSAGGAMLDDGLVYDCTIRRTNKTGRIAIAAVPPEEFLTDRRAVSLKDTSFCAHRTRKTVSDLIEMGYPRSKVKDLGGSDEIEFNQEVITRFAAEDEEPRRDNSDLDESMRPVWYSECYLKVDYDGDGVAEWRKVCLAGGGGMTILDNEPCDGHPFSAWCPYPQPHKLYGESMADKTMDLQLIKSTVWRQTLDGMYFNNAPQLVVLEGQANLEDVLTRRPGGVIRVKSPGAVSPLMSQDVSGAGFQMISYLDGVKETRTGIRRFSGSGATDALNPYASTATGAALVEDGSQDQIMLLARNFAEQGLVPLFERMLGLTCKHVDKSQMVRLRGEWVEIDPSSWTTKMDMNVAVGLGTGNRTQQLNQLMALMTGVDVQIVQAQGGLSGPMLTWENVYRKVNKAVEAAGFKSSDKFYTDPASAPPAAPQQQQPDPAAAVAQAQIAVAQTKGQADMAREDKKAANDAQLAQQDMQFKQDLARQKAQHAAILADQKQRHQLEMQRARAAADIEIAKHAEAAKAAGRVTGDIANAHIQRLVTPVAPVPGL